MKKKIWTYQKWPTIVPTWISCLICLMMTSLEKSCKDLYINLELLYTVFTGQNDLTGPAYIGHCITNLPTIIDLWSEGVSKSRLSASPIIPQLISTTTYRKLKCQVGPTDHDCSTYTYHIIVTVCGLSLL